MHLGNLSRIAVTNMSLVLQNFEHTVQKLQSASRPSFLTPFPFVNIGSFSPTTLPAANPVKRILLYFTPSATFPLQIKRFFLTVVKKGIQTHLHWKYLSSGITCNFCRKFPAFSKCKSKLRVGILLKGTMK